MRYPETRWSWPMRIIVAVLFLAIVAVFLLSAAQL